LSLYIKETRGRGWGDGGRVSMEHGRRGGGRAEDMEHCGLKMRVVYEMNE